MYIKKFRISGFGHFNDMESPEFSTNLNIIYGENEAGKTTIMNFINSMFFGLKSNVYRALNSEQHGGRLYLEDDAGELIQVERHRTSRRISGNISVIDTDGADAKQIWDQTIGQLDAKVFESVYWLTHNDIGKLGFAESNLSAYLYGASVGTSGSNYIDSIKNIKKQLEGLYKSSQARTPIINKLLIELNDIDDMQEQLLKEQINYSVLVTEKNDLSNEVKILEDEELQHNVQYNEYKKLERAWESWESYNGIKSEIDIILTGIDIFAWEQNKLQIDRIVQEIPNYEENKSKLQEVTASNIINQDRINNDIYNLGLDWDEADFDEFKTGSIVKSNLQNIQQELMQTDNELASQKSLYDELTRIDLENNKLTRHSYIESFLQPTIWTVLLFILWGFSDTLSLMISLPKTALTVIIFVIGVFIWLQAGNKWYNKRQTIEMQKLRKEKELNKLDTIQQKKQRILADWQSFLVKQKLPEDVSITSAIPLIVEIEKIKEVIRKKAEFKIELDQIKNNIADFEKQIKDVSNQILVTAKDYDIGQQATFLLQTNRKLEQAQQRLNVVTKSLETIARPEYMLDEFCQKLQYTNIIAISEELAIINNRITTNKEKQKELQSSIGSLNQQIEQLKTDERLSSLNLKRSGLEQQLQESAFAWSVATVTKWGLEKAKNDFEANHQPDVLKEASNLFNRFTGGNFIRIVMPVGESEVKVESKDNNWLTPENLSQGTREQLFIALRLGFLQQLKEKSMHIPVFMDDIFVNFDIERLRAAINILKDWSLQHQIFFFTCHEHILKEFIELKQASIYEIRDKQIIKLS